MIYQVVYISYSNSVFDASKDIPHILSSARKTNGPNGITGMLLYRNQIFLQLLEGDEKVVHELLGRISVDKRHGNMSILVAQHAPKRIFSEWEMAYQDIGDLDINLLNKVLNSKSILEKYRSGQDVSNVEILELFERFKKDVQMKEIS